VNTGPIRAGHGEHESGNNLVPSTYDRQLTPSSRRLVMLRAAGDRRAVEQLEQEPLVRLLYP
jgi:hypothetical protein